MKSTGFRKVLAIGAVSTLLAIALPTTAFADTTGGTGGGGGGNGVWTAAQEWRSVKGDSKTNSYTKFINDQELNTPYLEDRLRSKNIDIGLCKRSNVIWYLRSTESRIWAFNYTGATHGSGWLGKDGNNGSGGKAGTIENPAKKIGTAPAPEEVTAFKNWDKQHNGTSINKKPGYVVICSGAFDLPDRKSSKTTVTDTKKDNSATFTEPYSWSSEVKRQITVGGKDPIGVNNLNNQKGSNVKSNYGALYDSLNTSKDKGVSPADLKKKVAEALKKDATKTHGSVDLNAGNKAGMAEGGVLNVYEQTRMATVTAKQTVTTKKTEKCEYIQKWDTSKNAYGPMQKVSCKSTTATSNKSTVTKKSGTLKNSGFWQMLSVHCNQAELDALLKSGSYKVVNTGDASKGISAVLYTNKVTSQPSKLEFGDATNSNAAKAKSGKLAFYDKECPFDCTPSKATKDGASDKNGAITNVGGKNAISKGTNTNAFEFFRDNEKNRISLDVWYPKSSGVVSYKGQAPLTTTIARTATGTPGLVPTKTSGGQFAMTTLPTSKDPDGVALFTGKATATNQKNWNKSTFSNSTATMFSGLQRTFDVQSTWASEKGKPQVFNAKWEYAPTVSTKVFSTGIGFGAKSAQKTGSLATLSTAIEGKCYANFGASQLDTKALFQKNTGTGTTNNLDKTLAQGVDAKNSTNFLVNFVRSTTE